MQKIRTILDNSSTGLLVDVESHLSNSLPNIVIVGFANKSVDEAKERIRGALASSNIKLPKKRITINLAPADIPKDGSYFDFPILMSILISAKYVPSGPDENTILIGELGLDGQLRSVRGIIGKIIASKKLGTSRFWIPKTNLEQALLVPGIEVLAIENVSQIYNLLLSNNELPYVKSSKEFVIQPTTNNKQLTIDDVVGQKQAKRAIEIAAAGHHNILLNGPPGTGKTMLAKALPSIMPDPTKKEILEITHIHSLANKNFDKIVYQRPFRSPHHTSSNTSIVGGGQNPRPGEISMAHNGVLLLDEFPEFNRSVIEALRQPLEDKVITVARAKETHDFPADFLLVATANPCPCGYFGTNKECSCLPTQIINYQRKISGPILDRIDMYIDVEDVDNSRLINAKKLNEREQIKSRVTTARQKQQVRYGKPNSHLSNNDLSKRGQLEPSAKELLDTAGQKMNLSPRAYIRTLRVARTIADLEESDKISTKHVSEALQYRKRDINF